MILQSSKCCLLISCLLGLPVLCSASAALVAPKDSVLQLLKGYEWQIDAALIDALPPSPIDELLVIAGVEGEPSYIRHRALELLGRIVGNQAYSNRIAADRVWDFLRQELALSSGVDRRRLVEVMCSGFVQTKPVQLVEALGSLLESEDIHLKLITARCLTRIGSPAAMNLVSAYRSRAGTTGDSWEREALGLSTGTDN